HRSDREGRRRRIGRAAGSKITRNYNYLGDEKILLGCCRSSPTSFVVLLKGGGLAARPTGEHHAQDRWNRGCGVDCGGCGGGCPFVDGAPWISGGAVGEPQGPP